MLACARFVLYWMQASVRTVYNYALEYAICQANKLQLPLVTVFGVHLSLPLVRVCVCVWL